MWEFLTNPEKSEVYHSYPKGAAHLSGTLVAAHLLAGGFIMCLRSKIVLILAGCLFLNVFVYANDMDQYRLHLERAKQLFEQRKYWEVRDLSRSIIHYGESVFTETDDPGRIEYFMLLGENYLKLSEYTLAYSYLSEALRLFQLSGEQYSENLLRTQKNLAECLIARRDFANAHQQLNITRQEGRIDDRKAFAEILIAKGDLHLWGYEGITAEQAKKHYQTAIGLLETIRSVPLKEQTTEKENLDYYLAMIDAHLKLADIYLIENDLMEAFVNLRIAEDLYNFYSHNTKRHHPIGVVAKFVRGKNREELEGTGKGQKQFEEAWEIRAQVNPAWQSNIVDDLDLLEDLKIETQYFRFSEAHNSDGNLLMRFTDKALMFFHAGLYHEGILVVQAANGIFEEAYKFVPINKQAETLPLRIIHLELLYKQQRYREAKRVAEEAWDIAFKVYKPNDMPLLLLWARRGEFEALTNEFERAISYFKSAIVGARADMRQNGSSIESVQKYARIFCQAARVNLLWINTYAGGDRESFASDKYTDAEQRYAQAVDLFKEKGFGNNPDVAEILIEQVKVLESLGRYKDGLKALRQAHSIYVKNKTGNLFLAQVLSMLAGLHAKLNHGWRAKHKANSAIGIYKEHGLKSLSVVDTKAYERAKAVLGSSCDSVFTRMFKKKGQ